jgi:selenocysteine lyase/cysteine desulfurase
LIDRLRKDLPAVGYPSITPSSESSIASFQVKDPDATRARLSKANIITTIGGHLRVSVSVFNNMADVERLVQALS